MTTALASTLYRATPPVAVLQTVRLWLHTARQRRALRELDARTLDDIGMTREAAMAEAARPFWDTARRA